MSDLSSSRIEEELSRLAMRLGPVALVDETASTNDDARILARRGAPHGAVVLADCQSAGRGRGAHRWHSPPGENLYASLVWRPRLEASRLALLALAVGVGVARTVDRVLASRRAWIKWPNDVFVDDRKVAGVLVEATLGAGASTAIIGVGLNVHGRQFPEELASTATSLALLGAVDLDRSRVAARMIVEIDMACRDLELASSEGRNGLWLDELRSRDWLVGREVRVGDVAGRAAGIDDQGRLLVRRDGGLAVPVSSGEVSLRVATR